MERRLICKGSFSLKGVYQGLLWVASRANVPFVIDEFGSSLLVTGNLVTGDLDTLVVLFIVPCMSVTKKRHCWRKYLAEFLGLTDRERSGFLLFLGWFESLASEMIYLP